MTQNLIKNFSFDIRCKYQRVILLLKNFIPQTLYKTVANVIILKD